MTRLKTVFLGTPEFSVSTLNEIYNNEHLDLKFVVSNPSKKRDRGQKIKNPPVIDFCIKNNIKYFQAEKINHSEEIISKIKNEKIDLIIVLAFSQFISQQILDLPQIGCFNIHTSLLPKYRGAAPVQYALLNNDDMTGVSIQKMVKKMDAGDLCFSKEIPIDKSDNAQSLFLKLQEEAASSIKPFITSIIDDKLSFTPQDENQVSFAPLIKKEDARINLKEENYLKILGKVRAYSIWPKAFVCLNNKTVKILKIEESKEKIEAGKVEIKYGQLLFGSKDKSFRALELQPGGKRKMSDIDFINGLNEEIILS